MFFLMVNLLMLTLALMAKFRSPQWGYLPVAWFFISLLPCELPWLFALLHITLALPSLLSIVFANDQALEFPTLASLIIFSGTLPLWIHLHQKTFRAQHNLQAALAQDPSADYQANYPDNLCISANPVSQYRHWLKPFSFARAGIERSEDIAYGPHPRHKLDIIQQNHPPSSGVLRPVLLHMHGGGWIIGKKHQQAQPLLNYLAQQGWLCIDINYRLAPEYRLPDALIDIKTAIAWIRNNIKNQGGDPDFIAITGESAGGHLCALTALTANDPEFQPGFTEVDTRIQAAVPLYGIYDLTNSSDKVSGIPMRKFLSNYVMPASFSQAPELWRKLSPLQWIHADAPPSFIIQGSSDCLALIEETRRFVERLKATSKAPAIFAELEGAQHAFELFHGVRAEFTIAAIGKFLRHHYAQSRQHPL